MKRSATPSSLAQERVRRRMEPGIRSAFRDAVRRLSGQIDRVALEQAVASGNVEQILAAVATGGDLANIMDDSGVFEAIRDALVAGGVAATQVLVSAGLGEPRNWPVVTNVAYGDTVVLQFDATDPRAIMQAQMQGARLVTNISAGIRTTVAAIIADGQAGNLTVQQQARRIAEGVGLPDVWADAPGALRRELEAGRFTATRRLSARDKRAIERRLREGTVDEAFISRMESAYTQSLIDARALNIARTETAMAAADGQRMAWQQAQQKGALPSFTRRIWIVTEDDRLREDHAAIPGMNPNGVALNESYETPSGRSNGPPLDVNCRCSEGLTFAGLTGGAL